MSRFARVDRGTVVEVFTVPPGASIDAMFHPEFVADLLEAPSGVAVGWVVSGGALVPPTPPAPPSKDELKAYAAARRWAAETGGCEWNGHTVATDRESQAKLIAEFVALGGGLRTDGSPWKMADGSFVGLTNAQAAAMIGAAHAHIAGAFAIEAAVCAGIEGGTITTTAAIDAAGWPGND